MTRYLHKSHIRQPVFRRAAFCCALFAGAVLLPAGAHTEIAPLPGNAIAEIKRNAHSARSGVLRDMRKKIAELDALIEADEAPGAGNSHPQTTLRRSLIRSKAHELAQLRSAVRAQLDAQRNQFIQTGVTDRLPALNQLRADVESRFQQLQDGINDANNDANPRRHAKLRSLINASKAADPENAGMPQSQPMPTHTFSAPAPSQPQLPSQAKPRYTAWQDDGVLYAQVGGGSLAPVPGAADCGHTSADLDQSGIDAKVSPDIGALAQQLGYSPLKIFEYVTNEIKFEPYWGSLKGAAGTLHSKAGGPTDHASLLIALLRVSNIPARYVRGTVQLQYDRGPNWFGAKTSAGAIKILQQGKYPFTFQLTDSIDPGQPAHGIRFSHVWVTACVPYTNYRGSGAQNTGYRWIPLDASFKENAYQQGVPHSTPFDYDSYLAKRSNELPHEAYERQVRTTVQALPEGYKYSLADVPYRATQRNRSFDVLPASLPYRVHSFNAWEANGSAEVATLPDSHRYQFEVLLENEVVFTFQGITYRPWGTSFRPSAPITFSAPEIALKRLTLQWIGATQSDRNALDSWKLQPLNVGVPCGIRVAPELRLDGVLKETGVLNAELCSTGHRLNLKLTLDDGCDSK